MIDYNNKGIQLFILAHTPQSKLQSGEYIKSIVEYVKFIKNGYGIEFKAIPLDAESLKRMSMDPKNRIKEFPTILYAKSFYFGINNIKKLLLDLCRALEVKQKQVQAEANIVNPIDLNDIMKNTLESNDPDDINSENMQSKMSRFNRQRETVFEQKANENDSHFERNSLHGDMINTKVFDDKDGVQCFKSMFQEVTPGC